MKLIITLLIGLLLYFLQVKLFKKIWKKGLSGQVSFKDPVVRVGEHSALCEIVENDKAFPLFLLQVKFALSRCLDFGDNKKGAVSDQSYRHDSYSVSGHSRVIREYPFTAVGRGCFGIESFEFVAFDIFMAHKEIMKEKHSAFITVLPARRKTLEFTPEIKRLTGDITRKKALFEDPFEFIGIREYTKNDNPRRINWKASARTDTLLVNTYGTTSSFEVRILLNLNRTGYSDADVITEGVISVCATLAAYFTGEYENSGSAGGNISVSLKTNGYDYRTGAPIEITAGSSSDHLRNIEILLARLGSEVREPSSFTEILQNEGENMENGVQYLIISNERSDEIIQAINEFNEKQAGDSECFWILPCAPGTEISDEISQRENTVVWELKDII